MKQIYTKTLMAALIAGGFAMSAKAADFPEPEIYSPLMGLSAFSTVTVVWDYVDIEEGDAANRMVTITTPSGDSFTQRAFTEYVKENDEGGTFDNSDPNGENALTVSYYNALIKEGYSETGNFTEKGIYTISIPEGAIFIDGVPNPATELTYNLGTMNFMEPASYEFTYVDGVPMLWLSWDNTKLEKTRAANAGGMGAYIYREGNAMPNELFNASFSLIENNTILQINLNGYVVEGKSYNLELPANLLQDENKAVNPEQTINFTASPSGIISLSADKSYTIYNINGVKINPGADIDNLPPGIYIINGKKVMK